MHITDISEAPTNLKVIQYTSPAVFHCAGQGDDFFWIIDNQLVLPANQLYYENRGFTFWYNTTRSGKFVISVTILAVAGNSNTTLRCLAVGTTNNVSSNVAKLTVAGIYSYIMTDTELLISFPHYHRYTF